MAAELKFSRAALCSLVTILYSLNRFSFQFTENGNVTMSIEIDRAVYKNGG